MKPVLSAAQMKELERAAEDSFGMPASLLMENAGAALAEEALAMAGPGGRFAVLCGRGNNGGDGLVVARKLAERGRQVMVEVVGGPEGLTGEPARNEKALQTVQLAANKVRAQVRLGPGDVVIDALLGTGLNRAPDGLYAEAITRIRAWREAGAKVLAADLPSGLHADTGKPFEPCVEADVTASFGYYKLGQVVEPGASLCGAVKLCPIGLPGTQQAGLAGPFVCLTEEEDVRNRLPKRLPNSHKGTFGHVLVVAGSWGKSGAAALAAMGALRSGAGRVTVATRPEALVPVLAFAPELMGLELISEGGLSLDDLEPLAAAAEDKQALVIGPGIPRGPQTAELIGALLERVSAPCVLDADALNAVAESPQVLTRAKGPLLLTPHPGEMARLTGKKISEVQEDRLESAWQLSTHHRAVVALKGARTAVACPDTGVWVNPTGNAGMATAGTGDVLAGICGALLGQGLTPEDAGLCAVYAHGLAGDLQARKHGQMGLAASDLLAGLTEVWARWGR